MRIYQPMLFVGLGGTGCRVSAELERRLRDELCGPGEVENQPRLREENFLPYQLPSFLQFVHADLSEDDLGGIVRAEPSPEPVRTVERTLHLEGELLLDSGACLEGKRVAVLEALCGRTRPFWTPGSGEVCVTGDSLGECASSGGCAESRSGRFVEFSVVGGTGVGIRRGFCSPRAGWSPPDQVRPLGHRSACWYWADAGRDHERGAVGAPPRRCTALTSGRMLRRRRDRDLGIDVVRRSDRPPGRRRGRAGTTSPSVARDRRPVACRARAVRPLAAPR